MSVSSYDTCLVIFGVFGEICRSYDYIERAREREKERGRERERTKREREREIHMHSITCMATIRVPGSIGQVHRHRHAGDWKRAGRRPALTKTRRA